MPSSSVLPYLHYVHVLRYMYLTVTNDVISLLPLLWKEQVIHGKFLLIEHFSMTKQQLILIWSTKPIELVGFVQMN